MLTESEIRAEYEAVKRNLDDLQSLDSDQIQSRVTWFELIAKYKGKVAAFEFVLGVK